MKSLTIAFLAGALALIAAGCNSETTVTEYSSDGKIAKVTTVTKDSPLKEKTLATGGAFSALKIESTGSTSSGTPTANVTIGSGCGAIASSPKDDERPTIGMSWSCGILSSLTSGSASSGSITYIGVKGESASDTATRVDAIVKLKNASTVTDSTASASTSSDSASSNETAK